MRLKIRASMTVTLCLLAFLPADDAGAQFLKYTPPGGPETPPESRREEIERQVEEARFRLGPVRIAPWATLRDVAYVRNFFSTGQAPPDDVTATAGIGFRAWLRNGRKAVWTLQALPEYVWWREQAERRQVNGRYLLAYYGFFNRLTLELQAGREQVQQIVTPEVPVPVSARTDGGELLAEVELSRALFAFAAAAVNRQENLVDDLTDPRTEGLALLDREERITRTGLRWRPREKLSLALGAERSEVEFDRGAIDRSNSGTAPIAEIRLAGRRLGFQASAAARSLEARRGGDFVPYDKVTGNAAFTLGTGGRLAATFYGSRDLVYALSSAYAYLDDERLGASLTIGFGQRSQSRFFAETGTNRFTAFAPGTPPRQDDVASYGASLTLALRRKLSFSLQAVRSEFDANVAGADRSYTAVGATVSLAGGR
jgi:hypothetical protein